ncbi:MAG: hypothetical protein APF80_00550 [Alphaproteobacteria bacterium BRH_c36]|nr:MAG: hypothetical protein APF80_00550 [Alphaproteobacteria bacterium BRH_c36]
METGILGDLRRFGLDILVGLAIYSLLAVLLLDGQAPRNLPEVGQVLSINANAADYSAGKSQFYSGKSPLAMRSTPAPQAPQNDVNPFRFTHGWTALSVMAIVFAMLYAFNLALFRRLWQGQALVRRRRL